MGASLLRAGDELAGGGRAPEDGSWDDVEALATGTEWVEEEPLIKGLVPLFSSKRMRVSLKVSPRSSVIFFEKRGRVGIVMGGFSIYIGLRGGIPWKGGEGGDGSYWAMSR